MSNHPGEPSVVVHEIYNRRLCLFGGIRSELIIKHNLKGETKTIETNDFIVRYKIIHIDELHLYLDDCYPFISGHIKVLHSLDDPAYECFETNCKHYYINGMRCSNQEWFIEKVKRLT